MNLSSVKLCEFPDLTKKFEFSLQFLIGLMLSQFYQVPDLIKLFSGLGTSINEGPTVYQIIRLFDLL